LGARDQDEIMGRDAVDGWMDGSRGWNIAYATMSGVADPSYPFVALVDLDATFRY
jgi:hypothetical protein